ncbi:hypothetical protein MMC07_000948 [Pseudocyphellaria aurata]|nr:hypothetical protein [Pseudocyphellaria aurata]
MDRPPERRMNAIRDGFLGRNEIESGGAEVLRALIEFCHLRHPEEFCSTRAYLDYQREDVANMYHIDCCSAQSVRKAPLTVLNQMIYLGMLGMHKRIHAISRRFRISNCGAFSDV